MTEVEILNRAADMLEADGLVHFYDSQFSSRRVDISNELAAMMRSLASVNDMSAWTAVDHWVFCVAEKITGEKAS